MDFETSKQKLLDQLYTVAGKLLFPDALINLFHEMDFYDMACYMKYYNDSIHTCKVYMVNLHNVKKWGWYFQSEYAWKKSIQFQLLLHIQYVDSILRSVSSIPEHVIKINKYNIKLFTSIIKSQNKYIYTNHDLKQNTMMYHEVVELLPKHIASSFMEEFGLASEDVFAHTPINIDFSKSEFEEIPI